jgi:AcrR family transcriptional regulator
MAPATPAPPGVHHPKQARSEATKERIVEAAIELLDRKPLAEIGVAEIARRAGVSVGGFYARFASLDALVFHFENDFFERLLGEVEGALDPGRWEGRRIPEIVEAYVRMAVTAFRRHRGLMRQVALQSRRAADPAFRERVNAVNLRLHGALWTLLRARRGEIAHPDPEGAIDLGLTMVSAAMRETILFPEMCRHLKAFSDDALVRELTRAYVAFLGIPTRPRPTRRRRT